MKYYLRLFAKKWVRVAPVRERGLKFLYRFRYHLRKQRRSRKGAWIEIVIPSPIRVAFSGRSRKGAWIEIFENMNVDKVTPVAPVRERGLKLSSGYPKDETNIAVAPVRERGLKYYPLSMNKASGI